jgi:hypothetical protein
MKRRNTKRLAVSAAGLFIIGSWQHAIPKSHALEENARPEVRVVQGKVLAALVFANVTGHKELGRFMREAVERLHDRASSDAPGEERGIYSIRHEKTSHRKP